MRLDDFIASRIFTPLGMPDSGYRLPADRTRLTQVHRRSGDGFRALPLEIEDHPVRGGGGLYSTAPDYSRLLRCLLRGGELDGVRIIAESSVAAIASNQIGALNASMQRTAIADRSNDFIFMDGSQKFGFGVMIETRNRPGMRAAGSWGWGGITNTYFWVDPAHDLTAVLFMQLAPFANRASIELLQQFEAAVYRDIAPR
jgi:CubicO group peptidase (beta-lactamase class C family)